jgi:hypothetical protein
MVLGAVGDSIGYRNGRWEFNKDGAAIHAECARMGGVASLRVDRNNFKVRVMSALRLPSWSPDLVFAEGL